MNNSATVTFFPADGTLPRRNSIKINDIIPANIGFHKSILKG